MSDLQRSLFGSPDAYGSPLARRDDPATSHEAAAQHKANGKLGQHEAIVLSLVKRFPGRTYRELWTVASSTERAELGTEIELMRRLGSLMAKIPAAVKHGPSRRCTVGKRSMVTWEIA